jgi:hypothetical protein
MGWRRSRDGVTPSVGFLRENANAKDFVASKISIFKSDASKFPFFDEFESLSLVPSFCYRALSPKENGASIRYSL